MMMMLLLVLVLVLVLLLLLVLVLLLVLLLALTLPFLIDDQGFPIANYADPSGGQIGRHEEDATMVAAGRAGEGGRPTGILKEDAAVALASALVPKLSLEQQRSQIKRALRKLSSFGVTRSVSMFLASPPAAPTVPRVTQPPQ